MPTAQQVLDVARAEVGTGESPHGSNLTKYGQWYGMDGQPWCAMFVSWVMFRAGMPLTKQPHFAYCPYGVNWFKKQGRWHTSDPQPGDVVFYQFSGKVSDHVGIVDEVDPYRNGVWAIEGNTSLSNDQNGGQVMRRFRRNPVILGYGRPEYSATPAVKVKENLTSAEEDEMPQPLVVEWNTGAKIKVNEKGEVFTGSAPYFGSVPELPASARIGFERAELAEAVDPGDPGKGYRIFNQKGQKFQFDGKVYDDIRAGR